MVSTESISDIHAVKEIGDHSRAAFEASDAALLEHLRRFLKWRSATQ
jgi:hypothetical protein